MHSTASNLTVFFQTSPGVFDPDPTELGDVTITQDPSSVVPCDLDGDGDLDLAATVQVLDTAGNSSNLVFYYQTEPGAFSSPRFLGDSATTGSPAALVSADLDGDGGLDLISFNSAENLPGSGNDLSVFLGVEAGRLDREPVALGGPGRLPDVQAADLDADGDLDLLTLDTGFVRSYTLFSQRSPGVFDDGAPVISVIQVPDPLSEAIVDVDGDGDLDVIAGRSGGPPSFPSTLQPYLQSGSGQLVPSTPLVIPPGSVIPFAHPKSVRVADLDGDGNPDLVSANPFGPHLTAFFQTGSGAFDPTPLVLQGPGWSVLQTGPPVAFGPSTVIAADLDGDGDLDLASENATILAALAIQAASPGGNVTLFRQASPGVFEPAIVLAESPTRSTGKIDAADLDGDGDLDLFTANFFGNDLTVLLQPAGGFVDGQAPSLVLGDPMLTTLSIAVEAADLDLDGDLDLVSANYGLSTAPGGGGPIGSVTVFEQTGAGTFDAHPTQLHAPSIEGPTSLAVTDLDGDGEPDLVVSDGITGKLSIFYGGRQ